MERVIGRVIKGPSNECETCSFTIWSEGQYIDIISESMQAVKDRVFVEEGQIIEVEGIRIRGRECRDIIQTEYSRIHLKSLYDKKHENATRNTQNMVK